ncbi:hypothetical protein CYMTET_41471 [Cymbomonas tetramitiformis]|uniref:TLC domain-containing protein n=1 Tax=Cymbomonas tetramitiformis TaxID=36881 RepID=A0AAE0C629_9CHLO|nr:hypothetical protein CYMTET_41471 [Cymbomonas tetramitiformis]
MMPLRVGHSNFRTHGRVAEPSIVCRGNIRRHRIHTGDLPSTRPLKSSAFCNNESSVKVRSRSSPGRVQAGGTGWGGNTGGRGGSGGGGGGGGEDSFNSGDGANPFGHNNTLKFAVGTAVTLALLTSNFHGKAEAKVVDVSSGTPEVPTDKVFIKSDGSQVGPILLTDVVGTPMLASLLLFFSKVLVCWCTDNSELATAGMDLGFLSFLGTFAFASIEKRYQAIQPAVLQVVVSHLILEYVFNGWLVNKIDPTTSCPPLSPEMQLHHVSSVIAGIFCLQTGGSNFAPDGLLLQGVRLCATEVTTALPVAFRQAARTKRLRGERIIFFGALMPLAFVWRSVWSLSVLRRYMELVDASGGIANVPSWWVGASSTAGVVACNLIWTWKILRGTVKVVKKMFGKKKGGKKNEGSDAKTENTEAEVDI